MVSIGLHMNVWISKKTRLDYEDMEYTMNIILRDWFLGHVEEKKTVIVLTISHFLLFSFD